MATTQSGHTGSEKGIAIASHALGIVTTFVGPLLVYFVFKGRASPWLREHLDESLNYWILATVAFVALIVAAILLGSSGAVIYIALLGVLVVGFAMLWGVVSVVKAARGHASHYPLNVKLVR